MSHRKTDSLNRQAERLQKKVDAEILRRAGLLKQAAAAADFQSKARIHKEIDWSEDQIERWNRAIRRLHTRANEQKQPTLFDFVVKPEAAAATKRKGGRS